MGCSSPVEAADDCVRSLEACGIIGAVVAVLGAPACNERDRRAGQTVPHPPISACECWLRQPCQATLLSHFAGSACAQKVPCSAPAAAQGRPHRPRVGCDMAAVGDILQRATRSYRRPGDTATTALSPGARDCIPLQLASGTPIWAALLLNAVAIDGLCIPLAVEALALGITRLTGAGAAGQGPESKVLLNGVPEESGAEERGRQTARAHQATQVSFTRVKPESHSVQAS